MFGFGEINTTTPWSFLTASLWVPPFSMFELRPELDIRCGKLWFEWIKPRAVGLVEFAILLSFIGFCCLGTGDCGDPGRRSPAAILHNVSTLYVGGKKQRTDDGPYS